MTIPNNIRTPGTYVDYDTNVQRSGLPVANGKILFVTGDTWAGGQSLPQDLYEPSTAKTLFGDESNAALMIAAALKVNSGVDVQVLGKSA
jgi:phage tail sheath gpL-like